jgi:hypothetical protein
MKKASPPIHAEASHSHGQSITSKAPTKIARVLEYLLFAGSLNRFEAERIGDHCLHSTISSLVHNYGLFFERTPEKVPNHWGLPCDVIRYSLPLCKQKKANSLLGLLTKRNTQLTIAA